MRHFLTVSCVIVCFCACGDLWANGPRKKAPRSAAAKKQPAKPAKSAAKPKDGKHANTTIDAHKRKLNADRKQLAADRGELDAARTRLELDKGNPDASEAQIKADEESLHKARNKVEADRRKVEADRAKVNADEERVRADQGAAQPTRRRPPENDKSTANVSSRQLVCNRVLTQEQRWPRRRCLHRPARMGNLLKFRLRASGRLCCDPRWRYNSR